MRPLLTLARQGKGGAWGDVENVFYAAINDFQNTL